MKDYVASVVRQTIHEYLQSDHGSFGKHILVLLPESPASLNKNQVHELSMKYNVTLGISETDRQTEVHNIPVIDISRIGQNELKLLMEEIDILYVPNISHGFLAKLSLLIDDTKTIWVTLQMILEGKPVLLGDDLVRKRKGNIFLPKPSIEKKVQQYMKQLSSDGVHFCSTTQVEKKLRAMLTKEGTQRPLVLAKHMEELAKMGEKEAILPERSVVTPMAKDAARELGIAIKKEKKK
ncbi:hypothetical protein ACLIBG_05775 [Virgibacillus sp. W0181]|uniref:hypothetical protein n=1 Tax=Virgibacillus sp. W0181 TaxID=3391581 RepID=UPI003F467342